MTHDPLCPSGVKPWEDTYCCQRCNPDETPPWERTCRCDLIEKVRADERKQAGMRVRSMRGASEGVLRVAAAMAAGDVDAGVGW